jgi:hypothetical protein
MSRNTINRELDKQKYLTLEEKQSSRTFEVHHQNTSSLKNKPTSINLLLADDHQRTKKRWMEIRKPSGNLLFTRYELSKKAAHIDLDLDKYS